jgi:6-phosphogluconolactonase (cycloisomerase 2 family)
MAKRTSFTGMGVVLALVTASCSDGGSSGNPAAPGPRAVYVTNWASDTIALYTTNDDGSLRSPAISLPVGAGETHPQGSVRSHDGRWLYVGNWGSADVTPFRIEADGRLTQFPSAAGPAPKPVTPSGIALNPAGNHLYTANFGNGGDGTVSHYTISPDGLPHGVATVPAHGRGTTGLTISPDGRTLITANSASGDLSAFRIAADGSLGWVTTLPTGGGAFYVAVTPDSTKVLVTNSTANTVSLLRLDDDSRLSLLGSAPNPAPEPRGIVLDKSGTRAYVANFAGGTGPGYITSFAIEPATIRPSGPAVATGSNGAEGIALSGDGRTLYNANFNTDGEGSVTSYPLSDKGEIGKPRPPVLTGGRQPDLGSVTVPLP